MSMSMAFSVAGVRLVSDACLDMRVSGMLPAAPEAWSQHWSERLSGSAVLSQSTAEALEYEAY